MRVIANTPDRDVPPPEPPVGAKDTKGTAGYQPSSKEREVIYLTGEDQLVFVDLDSGESVAAR
jgi:hypothetical protein